MAGAKPRGLFVTGTDTGVGKTAVACALAAWGRAQGLRVGVMKPVGTGGRWVRTAGRWVSHDALALAAAAGTNDPWSVISPICFQEPLAPAIRPPTVPRGTARLRLSVTAGHTEADIQSLVDALDQALKS